MSTIRAVALFLPLPLVLAACGTAEFENEEDKGRAWDVYQCSVYRNLDAGAEADAIEADIADGTVPAEPAQEWVDNLRRAVSDLGEAQVRHVMPMEDVGDLKNMCTGWLWEYRKSDPEYLVGYESFTLEDARDAGVLREGPFG
ncbi:hypothetical protein [Corynebacterium doosanense]|uniref:Lipoprotein n=1 Tax=Corynebacterium doosanense CAU 212 = DSM 45436 TaxID=558173 RepID=A0A097IJG3_9CORY|nr:hypothetical protein [Corynebacterium doosanense]AIT62255.1 hypothetical protein CDOO_05340 [Corynebacterium doosanense CAU 212 = DSM 45436]